MLQSSVYYTCKPFIVTAAVIVMVLCKKRQTNDCIKNVKYVKLNEPESQHTVTNKPTSGWDYKKLEEDPEDDNLVIDNHSSDNECKKNSD